MDLIYLIIILIVVGFALYLVNQLIPMDGNIKTILNAVVILVVLLWIVSIFLPAGFTIPVGRYR